MDNVFKSKWGFHPCSHQTSRKLRFLNGLYTQALQEKSAWERWDRKLPKNRIQKRKVKDSEGRNIQEIVYGEDAKPLPWLEPSVSEYFFKKVSYKSKYLKSGEYSATFVDLFKMENNGFGELIRLATKQSRMPYPTEEAVKSLAISFEEIERLYEIASLQKESSVV